MESGAELSTKIEKAVNDECAGLDLGENAAHRKGKITMLDTFEDAVAGYCLALCLSPNRSDAVAGVQGVSGGSSPFSERRILSCKDQSTSEISFAP